MEYVLDRLRFGKEWIKEEEEEEDLEEIEGWKLLRWSVSAFSIILELCGSFFDVSRGLPFYISIQKRANTKRRKSIEEAKCRVTSSTSRARPLLPSLPPTTQSSSSLLLLSSKIGQDRIEFLQESILAFIKALLLCHLLQQQQPTNQNHPHHPLDQQLSLRIRTRLDPDLHLQTLIQIQILLLLQIPLPLPLYKVNKAQRRFLGIQVETILPRIPAPLIQ